MATEVKMPKLGIDMVEGSIARWLKGEGDKVEADEPIAEVETDKSTVEMTAPDEGVLLKIVVQEDELVPIGTVLAFIGEEGEEAPEVGQDVSGEAGEATDAAAQQTATVQPDQQVKEAEAETETRPPEEIRASPVARRLATEEGIDLSRIKGSGPQGRINKEDVEAAVTRLAEAEPSPPDGVKASPAARRIAREKQYNIADIPGTGPGGRILVRDVNTFQPEVAAPEAPAAPAPAAPAAPEVTPVGEAEEVPLSRMRKRITQVMTASKAPVPHFYVTMDIDMDEVVELRKQMNASLEAEGVRISYNDLVVKAAAIALKKFPNLNASFAGDKIVRHGDINIGIAVSTENGLLTIATRNTDRLSLSEISTIVRERAERAREGRMKPDDMGATTFTISNLGMYGVDAFTAILTPPETGVLAIGGIRQEPVVKDGEIVVGHRMRVTISADHRVTDGAEAAEYMVEFKKLLENPMRLML